jgi:hypothetical protein
LRLSSLILEQTYSFVYNELMTFVVVMQK